MTDMIPFCDADACVAVGCSPTVCTGAGVPSLPEQTEADYARAEPEIAQQRVADPRIAPVVAGAPDDGREAHGLESKRPTQASQGEDNEGAVGKEEPPEAP
jgi:hypothetical protein